MFPTHDTSSLTVLQVAAFLGSSRPGVSCPGWQLSVIRVVHVLGGDCPRLPLAGWHLSWVAIIQGGSSPGGSLVAVVRISLCEYKRCRLFGTRKGQFMVYMSADAIVAKCVTAQKRAIV